MQKFMLALVLMTAVLGSIGTTLILSPGCARPTTIVTPAGQRAFTVNEVLIRVERLQDAAIAASRNGSLPRATAEKIVFATVSIAEMAEPATQGWRESVTQAWALAKSESTQLQPGGQFAVLAAAIDELIGAIR